MRKLLYSLLYLPLAVLGQDKGIHFEQGLNWQQVQAKAKAAHQYIFVDCFASWCGPCRLMDRTVYTNDTVGAYFNAHFISVKLQLDKTAHDSPEVKARYADAEQIGDTYKVKAYPTFLFFSPEGKLVHRSLGFQPVPEFMALAKAAMDPKAQYETLKANYEKGDLKPESIAGLAVAARDLGEEALARRAALDYVGYLLKLPENLRYTQDHIDFVASFPDCAKDPAFVLYTRGSAQADQAVTKARIYAGFGKDWPVFTAALVHYTDAYEKKDDLALLNKNARYILQYSKERSELSQALNWSKLTTDKAPADTAYRRTYRELKTKLAEINKQEIK